MVISVAVVTYLLFSILSLFTGLLAVGAALMSARVRASAPNGYLSPVFERRLSLAGTAVGVGLVVRLAMVPLWFLTLQSLVPAVPGAMCATGVQMVDAPLAFSSSLLKILLPSLYLVWLLMARVDYRLESRPFLGARLGLLAPVGGAVVAESFIDMIFLGKFEPRIVACCTSLFDNPPAAIPELVVGTTSFWSVLFAGLTLLFTALAVVLYRKKETERSPAAALLAVVAPVTAAVFLLALHTHASPRLLAAPFHHCIFCLWQVRPATALSTGLVLGGLSRATGGALMNAGNVDAGVRLIVRPFLLAALLAETAGSGILLVSMVRG